MPLTLLVLDDDEVDREAVRRTISASGLEADVVEAASAEAGLALVARQRFDCILLDYRLPGTDGLAVLAELRARGIDVPVIALTGVVDQQTAVAVMKAGAADYLTKAALSADALERSVRHALHGAAAERERRDLLAREQQAREAAQAANQAKDAFLATLSHELRTPLNAILGWTHLLASGSLDAAATRRALDTIERNAQLQAKLIDDLLDVSGIVSGKLTIEADRVSVASVVATAVDSQRPAAAKAGIELAFQTPGRDPVIIGDNARLQQVMTNLLWNALKFTPAGGFIVVNLTVDGGQACISVTDSGIGIDASFLPHVFEQFRQADASTTRRQGGLGLGLAVVKRLVELHGGSVSARSEGLGKGAIFTVRIPLSQAPAAEPDPRGSDGNELAGISVLVVDDEPDSRAFLAAMLEHRGARVRAAGSASEALALARLDPPDVLLSDIAMPNADGYGLLEQLRRAVHGVAAAAVTACVSPEDRARALAAGFDAHVGKPVDPEQLVSTVQALAGRTPATEEG